MVLPYAIWPTFSSAVLLAVAAQSPSLRRAAVRALHGGADGGREHVATLAGVAGQVGWAAGLPHALGGGVGRNRGGVGRGGEVGLQYVGGGVLPAANTPCSTPYADRM